MSLPLLSLSIWVPIVAGLAVNGSARVVGWLSRVARLFQTGFVYQYAFTMLIGVVILAFWFLKT